MAVDVAHTPTPAQDSFTETKTETPDDNSNILDTVEGEIHFFRAIMRARPVGVNRHFHVLSIKEQIEKGLGTIMKQGASVSVSVEDIWHKLEECYNLEALEALETEYEQNSNSPDDSSSTPQPITSPKEGENLFTHPFFRSEFSLPPDPFIDSLVSERRLQPMTSPTSPASKPTSRASIASPAPPVSAARSPSVEGPTTRRGRKRKKSTVTEPSISAGKADKTDKADLAGLVSGDSDSSDLTQQSGDEEEEEEAEGSAAGQAQTPSERRAASVASGTDGGSDNAEDEEEEKDEDEEAAPRRRRGRKSAPAPAPARGRGRPNTRKRKR